MPAEAGVLDKTETSTTTTSTQQTVTINKEKEDNRSRGEKKGDAMGAIDGEQAAMSDYDRGQKSDAEARLPTRKVLIEKYELKRHSSEFRSEFLRAYRKSFLSQYKDTFSNLAIDIIKESKEVIWKSGKELGSAEGAVAAFYDLMNNYKSDWMKAYDAFIKEKPLLERYKLERFCPDNMTVFNNAFRTAYRESYVDTYLNFMAEEARNGTNMHTVSYFEDTTIYDSIYGNVDKADVNIKVSTTASLVFKQGTVYQDSMVGLTRNENLHATSDVYNSTASGLYQIFVKDKKGYVKLYKPITLNFIYGGHPNIGIYKWDTKRWLYQPTKLEEEGGISTEIPAGEFRGGKYAIFIDEDLEVPKDIYYNWAFDDIYLSLRREFIMQGEDFRPNEPMTRNELATILYRMLYFRRDSAQYYGVIVDRQNRYLDQTVLDFVLGHKYMTVDSNYMFNPDAFVTYDQFIKIVDAADNEDFPFDFDKIVNQMYYDDLHLPAYSSGSDNYISRAEVIYTLNKVLN